MFRVLIVDDEPAAIEYIGTIINKMCNNFEVAGMAGGAEECIKILESIRPDVLITDIKMTGLTGIELIEKVKLIYPEMRIIIISGYSDFEYMKKAINQQIFEYVLKPVDPAEFVEVMQRLNNNMTEQYFAVRTQMLRNICKGNYVEDTIIEKYFTDGRYYAVFVRKNCLPHRFVDERDGGNYSDGYEAVIAYSRDENEVLYLMPEELIEKNKELDRIIQELKNKYKIDKNKVTVIATRTPFIITEMQGKIKEIYQTFYKSLVCGYEQVIFLEDNKRPAALDDFDKNTFENIRYYLNKQQVSKAKQELRKLCKSFETKKIPKIQVENLLRQICNIIWLNNNYGNYDSNTEYLLEDIFYNADDVDMLYQSLISFLFPQQEESQANQKIDTPEYFDKIRRFIIRNISEPLTLNTIEKEFGVSQSHLSYMFRKYENKSFNTYLTFMRMEIAKQKLQEDEEILIRDVAQMVGYSDQFYFSRVFKMYTGVRPTEFIKQVNNRETGG